jgi:hypothetical protein
MNAGYVPALAALAGSAIGGLTSFVSSWSIQRSQTKIQLASEIKAKRESLYGQFIEHASSLYADALQNQQEKVANLAVLYTMINQMRLYSSPEVVEEAEKVIQIIVNTYLAPNKTFQDLREVMTNTTLLKSVNL